MPDGTNSDALHRLLTVARQLGASSDLTRILSVIIDAMRDLLGAERATVFEHDPTAAELFSTVAHGLAPGGGGEIRFPDSVGLAGESARTRRIINVPDAHADPRFNPEIDRQTGFTTRSLLTIPLEDSAGALVGVAQVLNRHGGPFSSEDEEIATALAAQAAVAIRRGQLFEAEVVREKLERDLEVARKIQQGSFPRTLPEVPGFEIEGWSEPADETGGDTYDIVALDGDVIEEGPTPQAPRAFLLLADATGHGVGPALSVTQLRSMLRMALRLGSDLGSIITHMNSQLAEDLPPGRFITAWMGQLDAEAKTLRSFSAGQGPLLHYIAADDRFVEPEPNALPLGLFPMLKVEVPPPVALAPGDVFAVCSDGIHEAMNPASDLFGVERVLAIIRAGRDEPVTAITRALREAVTRHADGRPANDDRTMIIIKRKR